MATITTTPQNLLKMMMELKAGICDDLNMTDPQRLVLLAKLTVFATEQGYIIKQLRFLELATKMLITTLSLEEENEINEIDVSLRQSIVVKI
jgi:hypothetical protein